MGSTVTLCMGACGARGADPLYEQLRWMVDPLQAYLQDPEFAAYVGRLERLWEELEEEGEAALLAAAAGASVPGGAQPSPGR